jgi:hypothetical protein
MFKGITKGSQDDVPSGLSVMKESDLGFPFAFSYAIQRDAHRNIFHGLG